MSNDRTTVWSATDFFKRLTSTNKLAVQNGFVFVQVSGLEGLEEAIERIQSTHNFVFVTENVVGVTELDNSPHTRRVRTVFIAMRHKEGDMNARRKCMNTIAELHRQFCSMLLLERTRIQENMQFLDPRITLQEANANLIPGTAICMFEISVDTYIDLSYNEDEWITQPSN